MFVVGLTGRPAVRRLPLRALPGGEAPPPRREPVSPRRLGPARAVQPDLAAARRVPRLAADDPARGHGGRRDRPDRARLLRALALARRCPRLAGLRRRRAVAGGRRRDARLAPDADRRVAGRGGVAVPGHARPTRAPGRARRRREVLRLAGRAVARCGASHPRGAPGGAGGGRVAPPRAAVHGPRRLRPPPVGLGRAFDQDSYTSSDCSSRRALPTASLVGRRSPSAG